MPTANYGFPVPGGEDSFKAHRDIKQLAESVDNILKNQLDDLSQKNHVIQGISCLDLGMIPNSEANGNGNFTKLSNAINQGFKILVDDNYYLDTINPCMINKPIEVEALNTSAKFTWKNGKTFLNASPTCTSIKFKNMQHVTFGASLTVLFNLSGTLYFEQFSMEKNAFEGNISLLRYLAPANIDPTITKHGFGTFRFEDNKIKNTRYSFGVMTNVPCDAYYIRRNQVDNFDYTVFNIGIENTHSFTQKAKEANKMLVAENNIVKNEDTWFGAGGSTVYYAFLVFEGLRAHYRFNHVEGIKCEQLIAVYDAYLSADDVEYIGNTWKNNICFNASKANNTLLKAKGGSGIKRYFNNEFIVEEAFATRLGKDPMLLKVNLHDITEFSTRWEINNNTFDVFYLTFQQSSNEGKEIWIENNTFKCAYVQNRLIYYRVMSGIDYTNCVHKVRNNTFDVKNALTGTSLFGMVASTDHSSGSNKYGKVIVDNNTIKVQDMSYLLYEVIADTTEIKRNTVDILGGTPSYQGIHGFCKINTLKNLQNTVRKLNGRYAEGNSDWMGDVIEDFTIQDKGVTSASSRMGLSPVNATLSVKYRFVRQYEILCSSGLLQFSLTFDYWYDNTTGYNMISFTDDGNVTGSYKLSKSTDTSGNGEGHGKNLKLTGTTSLIVARFTNTQFGNNIYLNNLPDGYKTIKIKTFSMLV